MPVKDLELEKIVRLNEGKEAYINFIESLKTEFDYTSYIPRWYNQPHYVEVWKFGSKKMQWLASSRV